MLIMIFPDLKNENLRNTFYEFVRNYGYVPTVYLITDDSNIIKIAKKYAKSKYKIVDGKYLVVIDKYSEKCKDRPNFQI